MASQSATGRGQRNRRARDVDAMPTGAGKQDEDHGHWRAREAVWASWGDQEAYDKNMAETKDRRDAARTVHEAKRKKKQEELEAASSTSHVTERQEKVSERICQSKKAVGAEEAQHHPVGGRKRAKTTADATPEDNRLEAMDVDDVGGDVGGDFGGDFGGDGSDDDGGTGGTGGTGGDGSDDDGGSGGGGGSGGDGGDDDGGSDGGGSDKVGGGGTGGGSSGGGGGAPVRKVVYKKRPKLYSSTKIIARLVEPWQDGSREWMDSKKESGGEKAQERDGTFSRAANEPGGNTSIPVMVKLLGDGLCADQGEGDIEISDGVYYKRAELQHLQYYYKSYAFDPKNIGVIFDETRVRTDGGVHVVQSVDHDKYTLEARESTITQCS
ncbi:unnamed protein product [Ectocarpus sp. 4 AP-2014]